MSPISIPSEQGYQVEGRSPAQWSLREGVFQGLVPMRSPIPLPIREYGDAPTSQTAWAFLWAWGLGVHAAFLEGAGER